MVSSIFLSIPSGLLATLPSCASLRRAALRSQDTATRYKLLGEPVGHFGSGYLDITVRLVSEYAVTLN